LYDIVAHSLGVIAVRAGVARAMPDDPAQAREALEVIEMTAKDAVAEMRHLLGALRTAQEPGTDLKPQPGLGQLDELVRSMRDVGLALTEVTEGEPYPLTAGQELTVYRIIQEALTNVLKHAGHTNVEVSLRYLGGELRIEVLNDGAGDVTGDRGYGLIGMRERVLVYGGSLDAQRLPGGRFRVTATLPRELTKAVRWTSAW
jgi:signal transduction histidine kinase